MLVISGCADKTGKNSGADNAELSGSTEEAVTYKPVHHVADHRIIVLLGPDFSAYPGILNGIITEYGLAGYGGMTIKLLYPDSFMENDKIRLSLLVDLAAEPDTTMLITLGAPEGTARVLEKIRAADPNFRIVTLFPLEDELRMEAVSNLLVVHAVSDELLANETNYSVPAENLDVLMLAAALTGENTDTTIAPLLQLQSDLITAGKYMKRKSFGTDWKFAAYTDPDTGLRSRICVVFNSTDTSPAKSIPATNMMETP